MSRNDYGSPEVQDAWNYIFRAAESVLEDDINEDDELSDEAFDRRLDLAFKILENPDDYKDVL